jgi:hypothetical protein
LFDSGMPAHTHTRGCDMCTRKHTHRRESERKARTRECENFVENIFVVENAFVVDNFSLSLSLFLPLSLSLSLIHTHSVHQRSDSCMPAGLCEAGVVARVCVYAFGTLFSDD